MGAGSRFHVASSTFPDFEAQGPDIDLTVVSGAPPYLATPGPDLFAEVGRHPAYTPEPSILVLVNKVIC